MHTGFRTFFIYLIVYLLFRHLGKPPLGWKRAISIAPKCNSNINNSLFACNYCNSILYQLWKNCFRVYHWSPAMLGQLASAFFWKIFFFRSMKQQAWPGKMPKSWFFEIHWTQGLAYPVESGYLKKSILQIINLICRSFTTSCFVLPMYKITKASLYLEPCIKQCTHSFGGLFWPHLPRPLCTQND